MRVGVHLPLGSRSGGLDEMPHQTEHHGLASHASVDDELAAGPCGEARGWPTAESSQELHGEALVSSTEGCSGPPHANPAGPRAALRNAAQ